MTNYEESTGHGIGQHRAEELRYQLIVSAPDVQSALHDYAKARDTRDSISRKLCAGSPAVTEEQLAPWEKLIADAAEKLVTLAIQEPLLKRHPIVAFVTDSLVSTSQRGN